VRSSFDYYLEACFVLLNQQTFLVFFMVTRQNLQFLAILASTLEREPPSIFRELIVTNEVHNHNLTNPTYGLCYGFRGVKLEEVENVDLLVRAEKPMYLLYAISTHRIFIVAQRSKDCLHPCRSSCLEVDMLLDVYERFYSCRQCWASKCRGL
jgi:hypothetical protein